MSGLRETGEHRTAREAETGAFTLVELLVIIAIIAILLALVAPAYPSVIALMHQNGCQNNHHQLINAVASYAASNRGYLTYPNWLAPETRGDWTDPGWLYCFPKLIRGHSDYVLEDLGNGALWKYLNEHEIYRCPAEQPPYDEGPSNHITSYLMSGAACDFGRYRDGKVHLFRQSDIVGFAGETAVLIWEAEETWGAYWNDGSSTPNQGLTQRHKEGATVGCVGGSAIWISHEEYLDELERKPGRLWCNPGNPVTGQ